MWFESTYTFLGGLGIFFYGLKVLSDSLQLIAGDVIRRIINALTTNRFVAVGVGALVTTIVQSSSITTVMVVSLVNAQLMSLTQAIGVIMGANIGTTITGWIIAIKVGKYGLLLVGLGTFPALFSKSDRWKSLGRVFIALGFVFMGLEYMSHALKPLRETEGFQSALQYFSADSYFSFLLCVIVGAALTCLVQSSSGMLAVTMALASTGAITFQTAMALVLGENIGTTITALLASVGANSTARQAARAHALFNLMGVLWLSPLFWVYLRLINFLIAGDPDLVVADGSKPYISAHIAAGHSLFNVINTLAFLPFVTPLARLVRKLTPPPKKKEIPHLKYLPSRTDLPAGLAITAAEKELTNLADLVGNALALTRDYVRSKAPDRKAFDKIQHWETVTDSIQTEITLFLCHIPQATLSREQVARVHSLIRAADELESIADYCASLARHRSRLEESQQALSPAARKDLRAFFDSVLALYNLVSPGIGTSTAAGLPAAVSAGKALTEEANGIRNRHRERLEAGRCAPIAGMLFSDMIVSLRKVRGHIINVAQAMAGPPQRDLDEEL